MKRVCNGKIDSNGRCTECCQISETTSGYCTRLVASLQGEQETEEPIELLSKEDYLSPENQNRDNAIIGFKSVNKEPQEAEEIEKILESFCYNHGIDTRFARELKNQVEQYHNSKMREVIKENKGLIIVSRDGNKTDIFIDGKRVDKPYQYFQTPLTQEQYKTLVKIQEDYLKQIKK